MLVNYIHGLNGHENGNASQLVSKALVNAGLNCIVSAPVYMVTDPSYMISAFEKLAKTGQDSIIVASSLGAFFTMQFGKGKRVLVNPALPENIEKLNDPEITVDFLDTIKCLRDNFFKSLSGDKFDDDVYIICGTEDNVAPNMEFFKKYCRPDHFFTVQMGHKMDEAGAAKVAELIKSL